ncbi:Hypothetical predicted protein [Pelobates cultripes]|uniref:Uncharacterized protein n=1 Tax=Pelobates cultripes TaxID=61616 RepID=A0AAD1T2H0_PELCU|nr:Hypothetical predicted protein [Pelobates cultripes]
MKRNHRRQRIRTHISRLHGTGSTMPHLPAHTSGNRGDRYQTQSSEVTYTKRLTPSRHHRKNAAPDRSPQNNSHESSWGIQTKNHHSAQTNRRAGGDNRSSYTTDYLLKHIKGIG